jgi:hypothetical protein
MLVLVVAALVMRWRSVHAALFLGAGLACAALTVLDATGRTGLRYFVPCFPLAMMLVADFLKSLTEERGRTEVPATEPDAAAVEDPDTTATVTGMPAIQPGSVPA